MVWRSRFFWRYAPQWIMAFFTIAVVLLVWRTLIATQDMARDARDFGSAQVKASVDAVRAASEANQVLRDEQRPWLKIGYECSPILFDKEIGVRVHFSARNFGARPAQGLRWGNNHMILAEYEPAKQFIADNAKAVASAGTMMSISGAVFPTETVRGRSLDTMIDLDPRAGALGLIIVVLYDDTITSERHMTMNYLNFFSYPPLA